MRIDRRLPIVIAVVAGFLVAGFLSAQPAAVPAEKEVTVYGATIRYYEAGQGPAVILLHGLGATKEVWMANLAPLGARYHVFAIDQIGFGRSDKPLLDYKIATFSDFLLGFMRSQNLARSTLVGNSLGGWVAADFAVLHPEMVDKLVLVDSAGLPWAANVTVNLNSSSLADMRALLESLFYDKKLVTDEFVLQVFTNHVRNNDGYTIQRTLAGFGQNQFVDSRLASIHAPTLVVWGREDELVPESEGEKFHNGISGARLVVFDHCGHVPQIEKAADFNRAVLDFLAQPR